MKLKLISDGLIWGDHTRVVNAKTGEPLQGVVSITWRADAGAGLATLALVLTKVPVELEHNTQYILVTIIEEAPHD